MTVTIRLVQRLARQFISYTTSRSLQCSLYHTNSQTNILIWEKKRWTYHNVNMQISPMCVDLPPGAAHRSRMCSFSFGARAITGRKLAAPWQWNKNNVIVQGDFDDCKILRVILLRDEWKACWRLVELSSSQVRNK